MRLIQNCARYANPSEDSPGEMGNYVYLCVKNYDSEFLSSLFKKRVVPSLFQFHSSDVRI
jgi:hypothetical protein